MRLAANLSNGRDLFGALRPNGQREDTCWATSEESANEVIAKSFLAGASPTGVQLVPTAIQEDLLGNLGKSGHADAFAEWMKDSGYTISVIDQLGDWAGIADGNASKDVRPALRAIRDAAENYGVTFIGTWHSKKGQTARAQDAISGSVALTALCRTTLGSFRVSGSGADKLYIARVKGNVGTLSTVEFALRGEKGGRPFAEVIGASDLSGDDLQATTQAFLKPMNDSESAELLDAMFPDDESRGYADLLADWEESGRSSFQLRRELPRWVKAGRLCVANGGQREGKRYTRIAPASAT